MSTFRPADAPVRGTGDDAHPYWDAALPVGDRVEDLVGRMTLEEKAGLLFQTMTTMNADGTLAEDSEQVVVATATDFVDRRLMSHFNLLGGGEDPTGWSAPTGA
ncbi:hypothetical protein ACFXJ5_00795 [Streptomyces sp. NPDC059373]